MSSRTALGLIRLTWTALVVFSLLLLAESLFQAANERLYEWPLEVHSKGRDGLIWLVVPPPLALSCALVPVLLGNGGLTTKRVIGATYSAIAVAFIILRMLGW